MSRVYSAALSIVAVVLLASCATAPKQTNLSPVYLYYEPSASSYLDPDTDFSGYRTFSVFPVSLLYQDAGSNEIQQKQLMFFLRNQIEGYGYTYVEVDQDPDLLFTIDMSSDYKETYVPPSTRTVLSWVPGQTIQTKGSTFGSLFSSSGTSTYSGNSTYTTTTPGHVSTRQVTTPGHTVGHFYPGVLIEALDGDSLNTVWYGNGVGTSDNFDVRVSGQGVARSVLSGLPPCTEPWWEITESAGITGIIPEMLTIDGNYYYPAVIEVLPGSPAAGARGKPNRRGIKQYDLIVSVDGQPTLNTTVRELHEMLAGDPGTTLMLEVKRLDDIIPFELVRVDRDEYNKRQEMISGRRR